MELPWCLNNKKAERNEESLAAFLLEEETAGTKGGVLKVCTLDQNTDISVQDIVEHSKSVENQVDQFVKSEHTGYSRDEQTRSHRIFSRSTKHYSE